jgi:S-adenosylmethionine:tRNA ribosyltransferase-isomerase
MMSPAALAERRLGERHLPERDPSSSAGPIAQLEPARHLPADRADTRLLVVDPHAGENAAIAETPIAALPDFLAPGDLLVVNDAATMPASLAGRDPEGRPIEARLIAHERDEGHAITFAAVLFGAGDWRTRTEARPAPPRQAPGTVLRFGRDAQLTATVTAVSPRSPRLVWLRFAGPPDAFWSAIYRVGRPVQYAHLADELPLWAVQNVYASRPWAFEMPSAGRPLTFGLLGELRRRGIGIARLTHAAGLSATGDPALDALLPLPERFEIPAETAAAIADARTRGGRIIAVGTTVVRALEGARASWGQVHAGIGVTDLRLSFAHRLRVVDGLLSGMHQPGESHFELLAAFAPLPLLRQAHAFAAARGYLAHELGDSTLILPRR